MPSIHAILFYFYGILDGMELVALLEVNPVEMAHDMIFVKLKNC